MKKRNNVKLILILLKSYIELVIVRFAARECGIGVGLICALMLLLTTFLSAKIFSGTNRQS